MSSVSKTTMIKQIKINANLKEVSPGIYINIGNDFVEYCDTNVIIKNNKKYHKYSYKKLLKILTPLANDRKAFRFKMYDIADDFYLNSFFSSIIGSKSHERLVNKVWSMMLEIGRKFGINDIQEVYD